jgi:hypothetical protein
MCWNEHVSLNTFLVSFCTLCLVYYNNHYTKYKIALFDNEWMYVLLLLAFSMQLIEFFIWRNINNKFYNSIFTMSALILLFLQPIASLMLLSNHLLRNMLVMLYTLFGGIYLAYIIYTKKFASTISKSGHLDWNMHNNNIYFCIWLGFLLFSLFYENHIVYSLLGIITLSIFLYKEYSSSGSMWCWFINSISIYLLIYLLFYLPFCENKNVC